MARQIWEMAMSIGEKYYLAMVIVSLFGFGITLAVTSFVERHWASRHGR